MADHDVTIISRVEARSRALQRFFTGIACKYGHLSERYVSTNICVACSYARWNSRQRVIAKPAKEQGKKRYFTGEPCPNGHVAERYISSRWCVVCAAEKKKNWAGDNKNYVAEYIKTWSIKNKDKRRAFATIYRKINRTAILLLKQKDYERHKAKRRATMKRWRLANVELCREMSRRKVGENREQYRAYKRNRKARVRAASGSHTGADIIDIFKSQKGKCACCRVSLDKKYHVDHIMALAKGGSNDRRNLQVLCAPCNQHKSARDPIEFMRERGMLL